MITEDIIGYRKNTRKLIINGDTKIYGTTRCELNELIKEKLFFFVLF
jgi:hypothetical protein